MKTPSYAYNTTQCNVMQSHKMQVPSANASAYNLVIQKYPSLNPRQRCSLAHAADANMHDEPELPSNEQVKL